MKFYRSWKLLVVLLTICFPSLAQKINPDPGLQSITSQKLQSHINYLASDALLGRNTPSTGLDSAAAYISAEFKKFGIQPVQGTYFNSLHLVVRSLGTDNSLDVSKNGISQSLKIKTDFVPFEVSADGDATGNIVFAGYGITAPEYHYDDYSGIDVKGKIVLALRHEPGEDDTASIFDGSKSTKYAFTETKMENAIAHGAVGLILVTDPLNHQMLTPRGFPWPSLSRLLPEDALPMTMDGDMKRIPVVHAGKEIINLLFGSVDSLKQIQSSIDKQFKPLSITFPDITVKMKTSIRENIIKANNVIGILPGSDPVLKNEYLVIGAHYDHDGFKKDHADGEDYILNGADDNASGTSGVLAVAEAFSKMKNKPKRSVLFMTFAGEEKGLLGSESYVRKPLFPLEKTVAMLNMDMISRNSIDSLNLEGASLSPDITSIIEEQNKKIGFKIKKEDHFMGGSDHASFYKHQVPFAFFFAGLHPDYHTVRDNPETINSDKAARISRLVFLTAWYIANDNNYYKIISK